MRQVFQGSEAIATPQKYCESMVVHPSKFGGLFICHIMLTNIEVKVAYVISGLVFQMEFHTNCWGFTSSSNDYFHN
jgi:hypothetical protein